MSTIELRSSLHKLIDQVNDDVVLQAHLTLLSREVVQQSEYFWDELSPNQRASIDRGLADLSAGRKKPFSDILRKYAE